MSSIVGGSAEQRTSEAPFEKSTVHLESDGTELEVRERREGDGVLESETKTCASEEDDRMSIPEQGTEGSVDEASNASWEVGVDDDIALPNNVEKHDDMEARRQRTLRDIAVYDRIGGDYCPPASVPTNLIAKLQKRKDAFVRDAQARRAPFEKFEDFDAFIDEVTLIDDQSWKTVRLMRNAEQPQ